MNQEVELIGVPTDFGTDRRGVDMGPSAIRYAGLADELASIDITCVDGGDITAPPIGRWTEADPESVNFEPVRMVSEQLKARVRETLEAKRIPLVLGGDHSVAIGSITGAAADHEIGVLWLDAHADFNTPETTPSGNIHGMSLAAVTNAGSFQEHAWTDAPGLSPAHISVVGLRDVDPEERDTVLTSGVNPFPMSDIDERGIGEISAAAISHATTDVDVLHVSLDLDFLDPLTAPGVGTPARGGVTYREAHFLLEQVAAVTAEKDLLLSLDVVEVNPIMDRSNETAMLATELITSTLGRRTLDR